MFLSLAALTSCNHHLSTNKHQKSEVFFLFHTSNPNPSLLLLFLNSSFLFSVLISASIKMAAKPLTNEAIALTEKKMDMSLDDIIKMSKSNANKGTKQRVWNRSQKFSNKVSQDKNAKVQRFMDSRSSMRQGALAQRRTNFRGDQFPLTTEAARKAAVAPIRNKAFNQRRTMNFSKPRFAQLSVQRKFANVRGSNLKQSQQQATQVLKQRPQTLDSLFANMKEQRMRSLSQHNNGPRRNGSGNGGGNGSRPRVPWARGGRFARR